MPRWPHKIIDLKTSEGRQHFYQTREWKALRRIVLFEEPFCRKCKEQGINEIATEVDHIVDIKDDPFKFFTRENLQALCKSHHSSKTFHNNISIQNKGKFEVVNKKWNFKDIKL